MTVAGLSVGGEEHKFTLYHDFQPSDSVVVPFS